MDHLLGCDIYPYPSTTFTKQASKVSARTSAPCAIIHNHVTFIRLSQQPAPASQPPAPIQWHFPAPSAHHTQFSPLPPLFQSLIATVLPECNKNKDRNSDYRDDPGTRNRRNRNTFFVLGLGGISCGIHRLRVWRRWHRAGGGRLVSMTLQASRDRSSSC